MSFRSAGFEDASQKFTRHSSKFLETNGNICFVAEQIPGWKYFPAIYFYNNISTNVNLIDNNFGEIVSLIISPMFFNLDHKNYYSVVRIINTVTILDSIIMIRCEVLHNQTDIVRMVNSSRTNCSHTHRSFFWSIFTRKSMKDTPKNTSNVIVKSETKKSIRNQGDGSIFHNHCNIECIMQYRI